jgi:exopolysaccharide biosynthesis polyprenyl glycosylphosphotransferase
MAIVLDETEERAEALLERRHGGGHPKIRPLPAFGRFPRPLSALDSFHRSIRTPLTMLADLAIAIGAAVAVGVDVSVAAPMAAGLIMLQHMSGRYADRSTLETQGVLWYATQVTMPAAITTLIGVAAVQPLATSHNDALRFGVASAGGLVLARGLSWAILAFTRRRGYGLRRTLILGGGPRGRLLARKLADYPEAGLVPVSMLPLGNGHGLARFLHAFPSAPQLCAAIRDADVSQVVLAPDESEEAILECVRGADGLDVGFSILPPLAEFFLRPSLVTQVGGLPLIPLGKIAQRRTTLPGKRMFDLALGALLLVLLAPIFGFTALAIKILDGGPVMYRQRRVGRNGRPFQMLKFRSMIVGAERLIIDLRDQNATNGLLFKVHDDPRVTHVGRLIRRLSIDELPQIWNVLRGEMSLVGPRPLAVEPEDFGQIDSRRHSVLPGITGYWQIAGGNGLTYEEMIKLDLAYIEDWSLWLDVRLLLRTAPALLHRRGPW